MIVYVTGGRNFDDAEQVESALETAYGFTTSPHYTIVVDSDLGAGALAQTWAREHGEECIHADAKNAEALIARYKPDQGIVFSTAADPETRRALAALFEARVNTWVVGG